MAMWKRGQNVAYVNGNGGRRPIVVLIVIGTRSDVVKTAPIIKSMQSSDFFIPVVLITGQHDGLVNDPLDAFGIHPDYRLNTFRPDRSMGSLQGAIMDGVDMVIRAERPEWVLVQGDTISALSGAMCAFYSGIPLIHAGSGLRTGHIDDPFPEEANRRAIDMVSTLHAAPTRHASDNLVHEGIPLSRIVTCGSTIVDALRMTDWNTVGMPEIPGGFDPSRRTILLTMHRSDVQERTMLGMLDAVGRVMERHPDMQLVFPMHPSPTIREIAQESLGCVSNAFLTGSMTYLQYHALMSRSWLVVTDSGEAVEEAPSFRIPVLILHDRTERMESVDDGISRLAGTNLLEVEKSLEAIINDDGVHDSMVAKMSPFGDGHATRRILEAVKEMTGERRAAVADEDGDKMVS